MIRGLILSALVLAAMPVAAQTPERTERVKFAPGATSATLKGTIKGYDGVSYLAGVRAGQTLSVTMTTSNASSYFNIWAPGADAALFVGSTGGLSHSFKVPATGDYRVQVYLMRNAARRGESARYTLTIGAK